MSLIFFEKIKGTGGERCLLCFSMGVSSYNFSKWRKDIFHLLGLKADF